MRLFPLELQPTINASRRKAREAFLIYRGKTLSPEGINRNQIYARLDCVENLTRQRHDRDQTENQQNAATVDSCFELVGSRQHGVAQQKVEHQRESSVLQCTW